jgi:tRNA(Arg) A34 adenosine deaminase TadA
MSIDPEILMRHALDAADRGVQRGQSPFGCAIARGDELVAACHNIVWQTTDITAHAEVTAIREACRNTNNILLRDCIVATTCEPCPMCMAALHWARVKAVYFGATIADAAAAGFNELQVDAATLLRIGGSEVQLVAEVLPDECRQLFKRWQAISGNAY